MLPASATKWHSQREELSLDRLSAFPLLEACHRLWQAGARSGGLPARLDPVELPRSLLPAVMLLDFGPVRGRLSVRLAGTLICDLYGGELKGRGPEGFLDPLAAGSLREAACTLAAARRPLLARCSQLCVDERLWCYTGLMLPLSRGGDAVDGCFLAADPQSMSLLRD